MQSFNTFISLKILMRALVITAWVGVSFQGYSAPTAITWDGSASGDWTDGANWGGGSAPTANQQAVFPTTGITNRTVSYALAGSITLHSIQLDDSATDQEYTITLSAASASRMLTLDPVGDYLMRNLSGGTQTFNVSRTSSSQYASLSLYTGTLHKVTLNGVGGTIVVGESDAAAVTFSDVAVTNSYSGGGGGSTNIIGALTASGTTSITNSATSGNQGYTFFNDGSSLSGGTLSNTGGYTTIGTSSTDAITLTNVAVTNSYSGGAAGYTDITGDLTASGTTSITNSATSGNRGYTSFNDGSSLSGGTLSNTGGYTVLAGSVTLTNVAVTNSYSGGAAGYMFISALTASGTTSITNSATSGNQGYTSFNDGSSLSGGTISNTGGFTLIGDESTDAVTLTNVAVTNSYSGGAAGYTDINGALTASGTTSITNSATSGDRAYTQFNNGSSMSGGTISNAGGRTELGAAGTDAVTLTNVAITNSYSGGAAGYTNIQGDLTASGTTSITNNASATTQRAYTRYLNSSTPSWSGGTITNNGGYTWIPSTAVISGTAVRNKIDSSGIRGYTALRGGGVGSLTVSNTGTLGFDINGTTCGFMVLYDDATLTAGTTPTLVLYLDTSATYSNTTRSLIYRDSADGEAASLSSGFFTNVLIKDTDGTTLSGVTYELNYTEGTAEDKPEGVTVIAGSLQSTLIPLLRVTLNPPSGLSTQDRTRVLAGEEGRKDITTAARLATHNIARAVMKTASQRAGFGGGSPSQIGSVGGGVKGEKGVKDGFTFLSSVTNPHLPLTHSMMGIEAQQNLDRFAPFRTEKTGLWMQPFGQITDQRSMGGETGYDAKTTGVLFGGDHKVRPDVIVGGGLGYALSTSEVKGNGGKTQIKDTFGTVFGRYFKENWYVEGLFTASHNRFRAGRTVDSTTTATNRHIGYQLVPSIGAGYEFKGKKDWSFTPYINGTMIYGQENKYVEEGAGTSNQVVRERCANQFRGELGVNATKQQEHSFGKALYEAGIGVLLMDPWKKGNINGTVGSNGFGVSSNEKTTVRGAVHALAQFALEDHWFASVNYGGEFGTRYQAHEGSFRIGKRV